MLRPYNTSFYSVSAQELFILEVRVLPAPVGVNVCACARACLRAMQAAGLCGWRAGVHMCLCVLARFIKGMELCGWSLLGGSGV